MRQAGYRHRLVADQPPRQARDQVGHATDLQLLVKLDVAPGQRVLDACAAPGGKTAHLLELSSAEVTALDIDPQRCTRIEQTLKRLGLQAKAALA